MTFPRALARYTRGAVNTMTLRFAGHAAFADLEHVGRKSGTVRHTPVRAFRTGNTVIVGLNFGRQSDWYQNIKAAGTCRMRLGGEQLTLGAGLRNGSPFGHLLAEKLRVRLGFGVRRGQADPSRKATNYFRRATNLITLRAPVISASRCRRGTS